MYQPEIADYNIKNLYQLKLRTKKPMTRLLNAIVDAFFTQLEALEWEGANAITNGSDSEIRVGSIQLSFLNKEPVGSAGHTGRAENGNPEGPLQAGNQNQAAGKQERRKP